MLIHLNIFFNGGPKLGPDLLHQSPPSWWLDSASTVENVDYYTAPVIESNSPYQRPKQPLPWSSRYQSEVRELLSALSEFFTGEETKPDQIVLSVGGDYGEQFLFLPGSLMPSYSQYIDRINAAALEHIDMYVEYFSDYPLTIMAASLIADSRDDDVLDYAYTHGVDNIETGANASKLQECTWGQATMDLFLPFIQKGMGLIINEEGAADGVWPDGNCPQVGPELVSARNVRMMALEENYGFSFAGTLFKGYEAGTPDMTENNRAAINDWIEHLPFIDSASAGYKKNLSYPCNYLIAQQIIYS